MTDATPSYNPEIVRLLAEVLRLPDSIFQHLSRMRPKRLFEPPLSVGTSFLSKKERYLLRWHREEVGRLLYEGCMLTLQGPVEKTKVILVRDGVREPIWKRDCLRVLRSTKPAWPEEREELRGVVHHGRAGSAAARLALRLAPSDDVRFALASARRLEGDLSEAKTMADELASNSRSSGHRSAAMTISASCSWESGDHAAVFTQYRNAALESNPTPVAPVLWFVHAVRQHDPAETDLASARILRRARAADAVIGQCFDLALQEPELGRLGKQSSDFVAIFDDMRRKVADAVI